MKYSFKRKYRDLIAEKEKELRDEKKSVKKFIKNIKDFFIKKRN